MKGLILTAKHHDGFTLWPSRFTEHSVKGSPWKNGGGDVVGELARACAAAGLKFGVYLSPWDRNHADYGRPAYLDYYRNQLRELLTNYGPLFEVWFDGANGGDGYYGGARERRDDRRRDLLRLGQHLVAGPRASAECRDVQRRRPGRAMGRQREGASPSRRRGIRSISPGIYPGHPGLHEDRRREPRTAPSWVPPEVDVSIRPGWFYHPAEDDAGEDASTRWSRSTNSPSAAARTCS